MNDSSDHSTIDAICSDLTDVTSFFVTCIKKYDQGSSSSGSGGSKVTNKIKSILDKVFYGLISVTMFLCFFSLCASMSANLYE